MPFPASNFPEAEDKWRITVHNCDSLGFCQGCDCPALKIINSTKYLGVILEGDRSWHEHASYLEGGLRKVVFTPAHQLRYLCINSLRLIYMALFQSILGYGVAVFGAASDTVLAPLERLGMEEDHQSHT